MRHFTILIIIMVLFGCSGSGKPSKPDNLIPEEKMSDIIYDVFLLNAAKGINKRILENNGIMPQEYVYKKHNVDSLQFVLSNNYYSYDTKTYEGIMEKVKQKIEAEKIKNDALNTKEEKTLDSLKDATRKSTKSDTVPRLKSTLKSKVLVRDKN